MSVAATEFEEIAASWRPGPSVTTGRLESGPTEKLAALLGVPAPGDGGPLPPLWHEIHLRDTVGMDALGADGHPRSGALLPPLADRRRMFGGATVELTAPLRVGDEAVRTSQVADVRIREGRSGTLLLVTEEHRWTVAGEERLRELRNIVYRRAADVGAPAPPRPASGEASKTAQAAQTSQTARSRETARVCQTDQPLETRVADERYLFAYSALTYNLHRIHYDAAYTREVEHHPALVVHGPLLVLWCAEHARRQLAVASGKIVYRLTSPAYVGHEVAITSKPADGTPADGTLTVEATSQGRTCARMTVTTHGG
ncbi:FAS1-like dehydratase domain-containing protein [Parafrankia sp. FMc2]|uniref:FAS1-like dehydratase domain-containing protein n=1 Tax=Parafrankia sp. FMc2 TaxID=3233196 RepID=UPI0034D3F130